MVKSYSLATFALVTAITVCIPFDLKRIPLLADALIRAPKISVVGNSVLFHTSKCDQNHHSLASMLGQKLRQPLLDLSFRGQVLSEAANLAAASLKNSHIRTVIFPVSLFEFADWDTDPIRTYALFRLINPKLYAASLAERTKSPCCFSGAVSAVHAAFDYDGVHYPDYDGIKLQYMNYERDAMPCPENDGANLKFIAANYYHNFFELPVLDQDLSLVASVGKAAARRGKSLLVVILPIDFELIAKLGIPGIDGLHEKVNRVVQALSAAGLNVVDLSASLPDSDFADRWCACGHLLETGRLETAQKIVQHIPNIAQDLAAYSH